MHLSLRYARRALLGGMRGAYCSALRQGLCDLPPCQAPVTRTHLHYASRKREKFFPLIPVARRRLDRSPGIATA